jgi:hypothetical protein
MMKRSFRIYALAAATVVLLAPYAATAQTAPQLQNPDTRDPNKGSELPSTGESLSERLNRSDGVVRPPDVDPDMHVTPADPGSGSSMPVIPPPGSRGDPSTRPK